MKHYNYHRAPKVKNQSPRKVNEWARIPVCVRSFDVGFTTYKYRVCGAANGPSSDVAPSLAQQLAIEHNEVNNSAEQENFNFHSPRAWWSAPPCTSSLLMAIAMIT
jgi:hypothetical protein